RQTLIYTAMGWDVPIFAHIPLIHGADGAKLSKRHGALGVEAYREMGYLAVGLKNYLVRLGWSHGDDEIVSRDDMIAWFAIDDMNLGAARYDFANLDDINGLWIRANADEEMVDTLVSVLYYLPNSAILRSVPDYVVRDRLSRDMPG